MADYYPLIARAIDRLSDNSPELRGSVYERARTALTDQLRSFDPPLSEADITREEDALEVAIARIEAERQPPPPTAEDFEAPATSPAPDAIEAAAAVPEAPALPRRPVPEDRPAAPHPAEEPAPDLQPEAQAGPGAVRPRVESRSPRIRTEGRGRAVLLGSVLVLVVGLIGWLAWIWRDQPPPEGATAPAAEAGARPGSETKFEERVGGGPPTPPTLANRPEIGVSQRAILYEEDPTSPRAPRATAGRVSWRIDAVNAGQGQPLETVVRAQVEVPDAGLTMTLLIRRNLDNTLPASHTAEIAFTTRAGESGRSIRDVGNLQFKDDFSSLGTPIAGQRVPLAENLFVIGLLSADVQRNAELMKRGWIDLPVLMASGQRAVLTFEKGTPGEQVMTEAWRQWQ